MKALVHLQCGTIKSPPSDGTWSACLCGATAARWRDPKAGLFEVADNHAGEARVLGIHNGWLMLDPTGEQASDWWQRATLALLEATPDSYLFRRQMSPVVLIRPGATGDTFPIPYDQYVAERNGAPRAASS